MKRCVKYFLMLKLIGAIILFFSSVVSVCYAETEIKPNIEPGKVYHLDELPNSWFDFWYNARSFWGKNVLITWMNLEPYTYLFPLPTGENSLLINMNGRLDLNFDNKNLELYGMDCLYLEKNTEFSSTTDKESAQILTIFWPINILHVRNPEVSEPKITIPPILPSTSKPSVTPGDVFNLNNYQFSRITRDVYARIVQFSRAQLCYFRIAPEGKFVPADYNGEVFLFITRGSIDKTAESSAVQMKTYTVMYLPGNKADTFTAGQEGCEILALFTPTRPEFTRAMEIGPEKLNSIIAPNTQPKLIIDAKRDNLDIGLFSEGASWMDGKLYFTGSKLYVFNRDGSCLKLSDDYEVIGTFPLPNGNLAACSTKKSIVEISPAGNLVRTIVDSYEGQELPGDPNELVVDKKGGIYFTLRSGKHTGVLYINPKGKLMKVTEWDKYNGPNGCILNPDGTRFFLNTSDDKKIWVFDVNGDGSLSNGRLFAKTSYPPDGLKIDISENLYIAMRTGIEIYDREGNFVGNVLIPKGITSSCAFGGDDMSTLYIIAFNGQVYSIQTKTKGVKYPMR
jgi:gluconolactonase